MRPITIPQTIPNQNTIAVDHEYARKKYIYDHNIPYTIAGLQYKKKEWNETP